MNNKTNYTLVGFFVILGFALIASSLYWLVKPTNEIETKKYIIYFNESVLGLNVNSPVKYRGIDVGKVEKLGINPKNTEQVKVLVSVEKHTPIKTTTVAKLTSQGITGLSYINLSLGDKNSPLLEHPPKGEEYPVIATTPSFFESFQTSFGNFYNKVTKSLDNFDRLLDKKNQEDFARLLNQSGEFMSRLNKTLDDETILHVQNTLKQLDGITKQLNKAMPQLEKVLDSTVTWENNLSKSMDSIAVSYLSIEKSMDDIGSAFAKGQFDIKSITSELMPQLNKTLESLNRLLKGFDKAVEDYQQSPRDIFFKEEEIKKAPGE